jgi:hypothetical protein
MKHGGVTMIAIQEDKYFLMHKFGAAEDAHINASSACGQQ